VVHPDYTAGQFVGRTEADGHTAVSCSGTKSAPDPELPRVLRIGLDQAPRGTPFFGGLGSSVRLPGVLMRFAFAPVHRLALSGLVAVLWTACGPKDGAKLQEAGVLSERPSSDGLTEQQIDINGDGVADVFNFFQERSEGPRQLVRKELDLNWDSRVDVRTWFDSEGAIEKEEMDGDFDGRVDWVDHYQGGVRVLSEVDADYNGKFDLYKTFEKGKVRKKERDTDGDGKVDLWEYFDTEGNVVKVGRDVDGDGEMDVRED
jgi:hypothetical protein